ncbi:MAG: fibronectin type III-like domain-contianing protein [Calditrichota bacterium]
MTHYKKGEIFTSIATDIRKRDPHQILIPVSDIICDLCWDQVTGTFTEGSRGNKCFKEKKYAITTLKYYVNKKLVQVCIRVLVNSVTCLVKKLRRSKKTSQKPGESKTILFTIFSEYLAFNNINMQYSAEPGVFAIMVGNSSRGVNLSTVTLHVMCKDNII